MNSMPSTPAEGGRCSMSDPLDRSILDDLEAGEEPLSLNRARSDPRLKVDGRKHDLSWIYRATRQGCRGVVLESTMIGGVRVTTRSAIARFIRRQATGADRPARRPDRQHQDAEKR